MPLTAEEQKALDHLKDEDLREKFQRQLQSKLTPVSQESAQRVRKNFAPLTDRGRIKGQAD